MRTTLVGLLVLSFGMACTTDAVERADPLPPGLIGPSYTIAEACELIGREVCAAREDCCRTVGFPYDQVGCEAKERKNCQRTIDAVEAGLTTFDDAWVEACVDELTRVLSRCFVSPVDAIYESFDLNQLCARAFVGTKDEGDACTVDVECASTIEDSIGTCDDVAQVCVTTRAGREGATCDTERLFCAPGWFCDYDLTQEPFVGTCLAVTPIGGACDATELVSGCGPGRHCDTTTASCTPNKSWGTPCVEGNECQSLVCEDAGVCALSPTVVGEDDCTGQ